MFKLCPLDKSLKIISTTLLTSCQTARFSLSHNFSVFHLFQKNCQLSFFTFFKLHTLGFIKNQQVLRNHHLTHLSSNHIPLSQKFWIQIILCFSREWKELKLLHVLVLNHYQTLPMINPLIILHSMKHLFIPFFRMKSSLPLIL